jgi:hypothetical protein
MSVELVPCADCGEPTPGLFRDTERDNAPICWGCYEKWREEQDDGLEFEADDDEYWWDW